MEILKMGDETLRQKSLPVQQIDDQLRSLVSEMFETLQKSGGIGLAAPQIGKNIRLFIVQLEDSDGMVFINPEVIKTSEQLCTMEEGCLSIPKVYEKVVRPKEITIQYTDLNGKKQIIKAESLLSRVIQHEADHLNGILFLDRIEEDVREKAIGKFQKLMNKAKKRHA